MPAVWHALLRAPCRVATCGLLPRGQAIQQCCAVVYTRPSLCPSSPATNARAGGAPWPVLGVQPQTCQQLPPAGWLPLAQTQPRVQPSPTLLACWSVGPGSLKENLNRGNLNAMERCSTCSTRCRARGVTCSGSRQCACSALLFATAAQRSRLPHGRPASCGLKAAAHSVATAAQRDLQLSAAAAVHSLWCIAGAGGQRSAHNGHHRTHVCRCQQPSTSWCKRCAPPFRATCPTAASSPHRVLLQLLQAAQRHPQLVLDFVGVGQCLRGHWLVGKEVS